MTSTVSDRKDTSLSIQTDNGRAENKKSSDVNGSVEVLFEDHTMTAQRIENQSKTENDDEKDAGETAALAQQEDQIKRRKTPISTVADGVAAFFPKVEPLKWKTFFVLTLLVSLP